MMDKLPVLNIWFHSFCPNLLSCEDLQEDLDKRGIITHPLDKQTSHISGLVVLDQITPTVCEFIREHSDQGSARLLALIPEGVSFDKEAVWELLNEGVSDVLVWNGDSQVLDLIRARFKRWREIDDLVNSSLVKNNLVGQSRTWKKVIRKLVEVARFTDTPVLFVGETGTGKELAARLIHTLDPKRKLHDLVVLDCTTIVPDLSGSELFGHERGAFTGAVAARDGAFALAHQGTLFLDEIGELPVSLQIQLLRVLQEGTYKKVGSNTWRETDFRLICATNRDLRSEKSNGRFRSDLYYRIANWVIEMPPLRERVEDILPLAYHFIKKAGPDLPPVELDDWVKDYLLNREYPGNVRDLKNLIFRIMTKHVGSGPITIGDIPADEWPDKVVDRQDWNSSITENVIYKAIASGQGLKEIRRAVEDNVIRVALQYEKGNLKRAAKRLGVTDRTLQMRRSVKQGR